MGVRYTILGLGSAPNHDKRDVYTVRNSGSSRPIQDKETKEAKDMSCPNEVYEAKRPEVSSSSYPTSLNSEEVKDSFIPKSELSSCYI